MLMLSANVQQGREPAQLGIQEVATPERRGHTTGTSVQGSLAASGSIIHTTRSPTVWPGPRTQYFCPILFIRANAGDFLARPITGVFRRVPDILTLLGIPMQHQNSPQISAVGQQAGQDNTVYAHVWNLGQAPSFDGNC